MTRLPLPWLLALALLPAACGQRPAEPACETTPVRLENGSGQVIEQLYVAPAGAAFGNDLLGQATLPSGGALPLARPPAGRFGLRAVWANGRAAEIANLDACRTTRVTVQDGGIVAR